MARALLLGTRKGLFVYRRDQDGYVPVHHAHQGAPVVYAFVDERDGTMWASLDHGHWGVKLHRSRDGGATWDEVDAPAYPEGAEYRPGFPNDDEATNPREPVPAVTKLIWVMAAGHPDRPGELWAGTQPGGLFVSRDGGDSWSLIEGLWSHPSRRFWFGGGMDEEAIHSILVDPRNPDRILIAISCAGVLETVDGGETWELRNDGMRGDFLPDPTSNVGQDPHLIDWCHDHPDAIWQQNHADVFRSTDGARTWRSVGNKEGPAWFGFPVAADEHDPDTAWIVPGASDMVRIAWNERLIVCRTTDGGESWQVLDRGLPESPCYDVVYRHALAKRGDDLVFGTTTGNVYASDDRGDSWTVLGNNLPPVYSVRFADVDLSGASS